jgi:glycosyltransferase involved in cell wall biosynthesis
MSDLPLVSIVTPSLNQGRFIEATIGSVLSQDYPHIEYIVVDGGSTDGTLEVLRRYGGRLQWISEPDGGQAQAINKGFRLTRGEIVAWLNSDDTYLPGAVSAAVEHLTTHPACAMVYGEGYLIDEQGAAIRRFPATEPFDLWKLVYVIDFILQQTTFFRRAALDVVGYLDEDLHWGLDWDLFIRLGKRFPVNYLPREMANLREHRQAKTFSGGRRRLAELLGVMRRHGTRRYPPAYLAYGIDTYFRMFFGPLEERVPARLAGSLLRVQRFLERPVYGLVGRVFREAQGVYADGWVARTSHFLLSRAPGTKTLVLRGTSPTVGRIAPLLLVAIVNGITLDRRGTIKAGDFEASWTLPEALCDVTLLEVRLTCTPTFRPSRVPLAGDRRRLGFQLKTIGIE